MTEKQRTVFTNRFFGRLVAEFTCTHGRAYFIDKGPAQAKWAPYRVVERGDGFLVLEITGEQDRSRRRFEFEGECYRILIEKSGYEYFCRVQAK